MSREMKDSGIEWIGAIPRSWKIRKVGAFFNIQLGKMLQPKQNSVNDTLEKYLCAANVGGNRLKLDYLKEMWFSETEKKSLQVRKGDLLVVEGGDIASCCILNEELENVYIQNSLHCVRSTAQQDVRILKYILWCAKFRGYIDLICNKATIAHFSKEKFSSMPYIVIPQDEQTKIANFLDAQCNEIDSVLERTRASIEEYKKLKQAVITQAVTKGVRGKRPMKDSQNNRWGYIPEEWSFRRVKTCVTEIKSGLSAVTEDDTAEDSGFYVLRTSAVSTGVFIPTEVKPVLSTAIDRLICPVKKGTLIVSRMNTATMVGMCAYVGDEHPNIFLPDKLWRIQVNESENAKFLWYSINATPAHAWFGELATGASASMQNITISDFSNNYIALPDKGEQDEIVDYLDRTCSEIDTLIAKKEQYLVELENYKKSLIYEYVTGKKEVR